MGQPVIFSHSQLGESIRMPALVHWQIKPSSGILPPTSCLKKYSRTTMACSRSTLSSNGIGHRTSPPLRNADCFCMFGGTSWTGYALYLFPQEVGIGRFQPYGRYTGQNSQFGGVREEFELGMNYVIAGHNARISTYWRTGNIGSTAPLTGRT